MMLKMTDGSSHHQNWGFRQDQIERGAHRRIAERPSWDFGLARRAAQFTAYKKAGGAGEFVQFGPYGEDGHSLFAKSPETWQPRVSAFLRAVGF
jgi:hypothetical protein